MRCIILIFGIVLTHVVSAQSYLDSLDGLINEKMRIVDSCSTEIKNCLCSITTSLKKQHALHNVEHVLSGEHALLCTLQDRIDASSLKLSGEQIQALQDLKFVLSAKVYLHYLVYSEKILMDFALKMYQAIAYWQDIKFQTTNQYIATFFFGSHYQDTIQQSLDTLDTMSKKVYTYLGIIKYNQSIVQQAKNKEKFEQSILAAVQIQNDFFSTPYQDYNIEHIKVVLEKSLIQFFDFKNYIATQYAHNKLPSYVERYWQRTLTILAFISASGCIAYTYPDRLQHFFTEHIKVPVERNIDVLTGVVQFPQLDISTNNATLDFLIEQEAKNNSPLGQDVSAADALRMQAYAFSDGESEKMIKKISKVSNLYDFILEFAEKNKDTTVFGWSWAGLQNCLHFPYEKPFDAVAEYLKEDGQQVEKNPAGSLAHVSYEEKVCQVAQRDKTILAHPIKNIEKVMPAYSRKFEREIIAIKNQANQFSKDVYILLGLTALIPLITLVGAGLFASTKIYNSVAYKPIRTCMRDIETFLNLSLYQPLNFEKEGYFYFLVEQLKLCTDILSIDEQILVQQDIQLLQSQDLNYVQKFNIVQRMYRTYGCLVFRYF